MVLKRWILSAACLAASPLAYVQASPQSDDLKVITVVQASDEDKEAADTEAAPPKSWLGIGLKEIEGDLATYLGSSEGVFIESVFPDSPAATAKLQEGDVILAFEGKKVAGPAELIQALRGIAPVKAEGNDAEKSATYPNVTVTILRRGQETKVELQPIERPKNRRVSVQPGEQWLEGASIFKFGQPAEATVNLASPHTTTKSNIVIVVKENDDEYIARIERDGESAPKIVVTHNKEERELSEKELDQLPAKVQQAIKNALKSPQLKMKVESKSGDSKSSESGAGQAVDDKEQTSDAVTEHLEKAMKQVGAGEVHIQLDGLAESLNDLKKGRVIVIDPSKLQDFHNKSEEFKAQAKKMAESGMAQARNLAELPEQLKNLKLQVEELKKQLEEMRTELKASKK